MSWYKVQLTWEQQADNEMANIQAQLYKIWHALGFPKGFALYQSNGDTEPVTFYFSPGASKVGDSIIKNYEGTPCEKPQLSIIELIIGYNLDRIDSL